MLRTIVAARVALGALGHVLVIACAGELSGCHQHFASADFCSSGKGPRDWPKVDNSAILQRYWQGSDGEAEVASDLGATDGRSIAEAAKLAVIGRGREIYPHFDAYMLSFLIEPFVPRIVAKVHVSAADESEVAGNIADWAASDLVHAQTVSTFRDQCGHDPWGGIPSGKGCSPFYKKANAGEMLAKSMYTGKLTGKCEALPSLVASVFALSGAPWEDVVILRLKSHNLGLVRFGGQIYLIDNTVVSAVDEATKQSLLANTYLGFASYSVAVYGELAKQGWSFALDETVFSANHSLLENLLLLTGTRDQGVKDAAAELGKPEGGRIDSARVFAFNPLATYAYQSLGVSDPESYLKASAQAPRARELASELKDDADVVRWIRDNVTYGSIFEESSRRIMTAEDVIVFRRGSWKDQAVLAAVLLKRMGYSPEMFVTADDAFVALGDGTVYEARGWQEVPAVSGTVLLQMSPP
jgi:hypothetical protein